MKEANITLQVAEVVYDVENKTHLISRSRAAADGAAYEAASQMQTSGEDGGGYQVRRSIEDGYSEICARLAEYISADEASASNLVRQAIDNDGALTVRLAMPDDFNMALVPAMASAMHDYLVCRAVHDWFMLTNPGEAASYAAKAESALDKLQELKNMRWTLRRPLKPW